MAASVEDTSQTVLEQLYLSHFTTQYLTAAGATLLIWDMILTFNDEIERVWRAKKTLGTTLFFFNRYIPPLMIVYDLYYAFTPEASFELMVSVPLFKLCKNYEISYGILGLVSIASVESVLILRTNALCRSNFTFVLLLFLGMVSLLTTLAFFLIIVANTNYHSLGASARSNVLAVVLRDGLVYYFVMMGICLTSAVLWGIEPVGNFYSATLGKCLQATMCSRMLLNLRGLLESTTGTSRFGSASAGTILYMDTAEIIDEGDEGRITWDSDMHIISG
ncbi:hypothetical protein CPC08DRAFT_764011 [Agrocybe pediades]|nr:hypothetical protein CPC08DRAFT_764011 [Agrocybe pediades]